MSNLVEHARRELAAINEDPEHIEGLLKVIQAFADMGCSGGQSAVAIEQLGELLEFHNLSPLTDDPEEWHFHGNVSAHETGLWQNKRRGEAFSHDAGKTYYLISEGGTESSWLNGLAKMHTSRHGETPKFLQAELAFQAADNG